MSKFPSYLDDLEDEPEKVAEEILNKGFKSPAHIPMPHVRDHGHLTPVFAFDHLSLQGSDFCFDNPNIPKEDWISFMRKCKEVSALEYSEMLDRSYEDEHRFHEVPFKKLEPCGLIQHLKDVCSKSAKSSKIIFPDIYQFGLYTNQEEQKAPRILGFVGKWGVFNLLWFDLNHAVYKH